MTVEASGQRWWIRPPTQDESLRSMLSRAAALYERSPQQMWECLNRDDPKPAGDVESPSCAALLRMANAIGVPASVLFTHRHLDAPWLLAPHARGVYCPICWSEDQSQGEPCSIRRGWSGALRTTCQKHHYPLRLAPEDWATSSPPLPQPYDFTQQEKQILDLIESFGKSLEESIRFGAPWPSHWFGSSQIARQVLLAVSFNVNTVKDFPLTSYVRVSPNLAGLVRGPKHQQDSLRQPRWDAYRELADPAVRRAGLWITAWALMRDRPDSLSPGWSTMPTHIQARMRYIPPVKGWDQVLPADLPR